MSSTQPRIAKARPKSRPEASLVTKWSIKKTAPSDDAARVRNNQRRHRERVRTYITELETKVANLEDHLGAASVTIEDLRRENEALRKGVASQGPRVQSPAIHNESGLLGALRPTEPLPSAHTATDRSKFDRLCCRPRLADVADANEDDPEDLPVPQEGESTTSCETAYRMLEQQSAGNLDADTAEQFLRPGYRRALRQGDGCRVQTQLVYGLLDHITS